MSFRHAKRGFTLVELLVVIAIIAMLVTLLLPAVQAAREAARTIQCKNNLKQMGLSLLNYHDAVGEYPLGVYGAAGSSVGYGWATKLLPFIEEQGIYDLIAVNYISGQTDTSPWDVPDMVSRSRSSVPDGVIPGGGVEIAVFKCPSSPLQPHAPAGSAAAGYATSDYKACNGFADRGMFFHISDGLNALGGPYRDVAIKKIDDGTSKTIALGESAYVPALNNWPVWIGGVGSDESALFKTQPPSVINCSQGVKIPGSYGAPAIDDDCAFGWHSGDGAQFVFADGSVHFLSTSIEWITYQNLGDRADGMVLGSFE